MKKVDCINCGYCCLSSICSRGFLRGERCAYLIQYGSRYYCYLYKEPNDPETYPHFGSGCPFPDNPLRRKLRQQLDLMPDVSG